MKNLIVIILSFFIITGLEAKSFAILFNGAITEDYFYYRYHKSLKKIYQALVERGIAQDDIYILSANANCSDEEVNDEAIKQNLPTLDEMIDNNYHGPMQLPLVNKTGSYKCMVPIFKRGRLIKKSYYTFSQNIETCFKNQKKIDYSATKKQLLFVIKKISTLIKDGDNLILFISNHGCSKYGGSFGTWYKKSATIKDLLHHKECYSMSSKQLAFELDSAFGDKKISIYAIHSFCYAGLFSKLNLKNPYWAIATSDYDSFTYNAEKEMYFPTAFAEKFKDPKNSWGKAILYAKSEDNENNQHQTTLTNFIREKLHKRYNLTGKEFSNLQNYLNAPVPAQDLLQLYEQYQKNESKVAKNLERQVYLDSLYSPIQKNIEIFEENPLNKAIKKQLELQSKAQKKARKNKDKLEYSLIKQLRIDINDNHTPLMNLHNLLLEWEFLQTATQEDFLTYQQLKKMEEKKDF